VYGGGIPAEFRSNSFKKVTQADATMGQEKEGMGMA
jgi:hypothetical protein